ncbi:hypothetical protein AX15_004864 [Amanita polypyramis BW_CC]|nr:hypothetical protein AX15_004864 [Amanita polypyramis BW_CC]
MSTARNIQTATIVSSSVSALAYGAYLTTFIHCLRWLVYNNEGWSRRDARNISMLIVSIALFLLQTAGLASYFEGALIAHDLNVRGYDLSNAINSITEYITFHIVDAVLVCSSIAPHQRWQC